LAFGGVGDSVFVNYHGEYGFNAFTHFKSIIEKPFWGETQIKYPPYSKRKFRWLKRFLGT
jgi:aldehyde dehydrogenase (NAD+)